MSSGAVGRDVSIFNPKLLLSEEPVTTTNLSIVTETYQIDEPDPLRKNVIHGKKLRCCGNEEDFTSSLVSCMEFSNCVEAQAMETHLKALRKAVGIVGSVVETGPVVEHIKSNPTISIPLPGSVSKSTAVLDLKPKGPSTPVGSIQAAPNTSSPKAPVAELKSGNSNPLQFGSFQPVPKDRVILVTERISTTSFDDWLNSKPGHEDALILFSDLFDIVKKVHKNKMCIGNVRYGIRISGHKPMLVFPARSEEKELDEGIWSDLRELRRMVNEAMPSGTHELHLFNHLCQKYAGDVNSVSELKHRGDKLREGSFLILSSPIIWNSPKRYDFVRKLGEYRSLHKSEYDKLVDDFDPNSGNFVQAIPNVQWYARLGNGGRIESLLYNVYTHSPPSTYRTTESIRYFQRCVYEHLKSYFWDYTDVSDLLYKIYPEAPSKLYKLMIDKLYHTACNSQLPPVIEFFGKEPHPL